MKIPQYLAEVRHAVETVLTAIHYEKQELRRLESEVVALTSATAEGYRRAEFLAMNPDLDDEGLGTQGYFDTYFGPDKQRFHKNAEIEGVKKRMEIRRFSTAALSGSLLQYAKQGIAVHYGTQHIGCPDGRLIVSIPLYEVIWQGRNQALHWEEGNFRPAVVRCFDALANSLDPVFAEYKQRSMAYEVIDYLGWQILEEFERDMFLLVI